MKRPIVLVAAGITLALAACAARPYEYGSVASPAATARVTTRTTASPETASESAPERTPDASVASSVSAGPTSGAPTSAARTSARPRTSGTPSTSSTRSAAPRRQRSKAPKDRGAKAPQGPSGLKPGTNHNAAASAYAYPAKEVHDWLYGAGKKSPTFPKDKLAFLTFDDGPSPMTPHVLDELKKAGVPASFFVIGGPQSVESPSGRYLRDEIAAGNAVCIHSYSHNYSYLYPGRVANTDHVVKDYDKAVASVRRVLGDDYRSTCQRYPGGHMSWKGMRPADKAMQAKNVWYIDWNAENGDGTGNPPATASGRAALVMSEISYSPRVVVVLMHDFAGNSVTKDSIGILVKQLKAKGYRFGIME